jgi:hypothetical protein
LASFYFVKGFWGACSAEIAEETGTLFKGPEEGRGVLKIKAKKTLSPVTLTELRVFLARIMLTTAGAAASGPSSEADIGGNTKACPAPLVYVVHFYLFGLFL